VAKSAKHLDIVCVGNVVVDAVGVYVDAIPEEGALALFDRVEMHLGGCANNTSLALAKLGLNVGLIAKVGVDGLGDYVSTELSRHGVDVRGLCHSKADASSFSFVMVPTHGNRRILHTLAANETFGPKDIDTKLFNGAKWVCVGGLALLPGLHGKDLAQVLTAAKKSGAQTAADPAINDRFSRKEGRALLEPSYKYLDVLFPSEIEAQAITGHKEPRKICAALRNLGVKIAGVKLGEKGCAVMSKEGYFEIPCYKVKCVDTCGAGDCFMAGLLAGLLRGYAPAEAARLGSAVSAHCVQAIGATTGIPKLNRVLSFQKQSGRSKSA
jgi:sugar/nucleoside kinase (ribokinase family)